MLASVLWFALVASPVPAASGGMCTGPDPAIVKTALQSSTQNGSLRHLIVAISADCNTGNDEARLNV